MLVSLFGLSHGAVGAGCLGKDSAQGPESHAREWEQPLPNLSRRQPHPLAVWRLVSFEISSLGFSFLM
jgi:hypothetical protein